MVNNCMKLVVNGGFVRQWKIEDVIEANGLHNLGGARSSGIMVESFHLNPHAVRAFTN